MRPQGSPEELERRRRRGIELLKAGASVTEVARRLGCSHSSVILWREAVRRRGLKALTAKPAPGRPSKLTAAQQRTAYAPRLKPKRKTRSPSAAPFAYVVNTAGGVVPL